MINIILYCNPDQSLILHLQEDGEEFLRRWKDDIRRRRERYRKEVMKAVKGAREGDTEEEEEG